MPNIQRNCSIRSKRMRPDNLIPSLYRDSSTITLLIKNKSGKNYPVRERSPNSMEMTQEIPERLRGKFLPQKEFLAWRKIYTNGADHYQVLKEVQKIISRAPV